MLVMQAADEAAQVLAYLERTPIEDVLDLHGAFTSLASKIRVYAEAVALNVPTPNAEEIATGYRHSNTVRNELAFAARLTGRVQRFAYPDITMASGLLRERLADLSRALSAVLTSLGDGDLFEVERVLASESPAVYQWLNAVEQIQLQLTALIRSYDAVLGVAQGWAALAQPAPGGTTHRVRVRHAAGSLSLSQAGALLGFLDAVFTVAAVAADKDPADLQITLERLETGSRDTLVKSVPREVWDQAREIFGRVTNPGATAIQNIDSARAALEKLNESEEAGKLSKEQANALRGKIFDAVDVLVTMEGGVVEVDGQPVATVRVDPALAPPKEQKALPPGPSRRRRRKIRVNEI